MQTEQSTNKDGESLIDLEQAVDIAREQASEAAEAFRKGEFTQGEMTDNEATRDDRLIALLTYISPIFIPFIMSIIILFSESGKKRPFQRYHAMQSLGLTAVFAILGISTGIGLALIQIIPIIGQLILIVSICLAPIFMIMAVMALVYYGYQAYRGKRFAIPGLTSFLQDQGWL